MVGNHQKWGVAPTKSALGIAIRAVQPAIQPFPAFDAGPLRLGLAGMLVALFDLCCPSGLPRLLRRLLQ